VSGIGAFWWGLFGGIIAEALTWYKDRLNPTTALPWRKYWAATIIMILIGGGLVLMYQQSGAGLNPILCVNIGASAPLIIAALTSIAPKVPPGNVN